MANMIDVDSKEIVKFANKLEKIGKYELPVVARQTLNEMAFQMKGFGGQRGMIDKEAENQFDYQRNKTLFRAFTGLRKSSGNDINKMSSESGIIKRSGRDQLAESLAQQQKGGDIKSGSTPISTARISKDLGKKVRRPNYLNRITPVDLRRNKGKRFVVRANQAKKNNRDIIFTSRTGVDFVARIKRISRTVDRLINMTLLYRLNPGTVRLSKKRPFVNDAAVKVVKKAPKIFEQKTNARIKRKFEKR